MAVTATVKPLVEVLPQNSYIRSILSFQGKATGDVSAGTVTITCNGFVPNTGTADLDKSWVRVRRILCSHNDGGVAINCSLSAGSYPWSRFRNTVLNGTINLGTIALPALGAISPVNSFYHLTPLELGHPEAGLYSSLVFVFDDNNDGITYDVNVVAELWNFNPYRYPDSMKMLRL